MSVLTASLLGWVALSPCAAPVPPTAAPDPTGRGYLGVWFNLPGDGGPPLGIGRFSDNSPAQKAGLKAGDVFVRINTLRPKDTAEMVNHVMSYRPGATIEVEVQRGDERKTFKVTLAARPANVELPAPVPQVIPR